ncbi:MAG: UDP-N-acetylglucosamine 4,6-dehydratase (inverting) [Magnetococcales bacterium]|nr:UDP-N-acetylglucosamine 4,6-dehydratase (inverting) [Magnetococcales bacterium]
MQNNLTCTGFHPLSKTIQSNPSGQSNPSARFCHHEPDLNDRAILVTGGTGSFGRHFIRTVLTRYRPRRLVVLSRDELKQFEMQQEPLFQHPALRFFIGDVRDRDRLERAFSEIDIVVHAAAMKQVPTAEYNPFECIHTNVLGAENVVQAALRARVSQVLALSTDKAANPVNLYGASKLASDKIFVAANHLSGHIGTRFAVVRYGNVVGSRGSVIPFFQKLIANGATSLPITDARMSRFWITLQEGVDFVLSSLEMMRGGEIFVPKIPSMNIIELARAMAPQLPHHIVGIRPGEKLHEVMVTEDDSRTTVELHDRYVIEPAFALWCDYVSHRNQPDAKPVADSFRYASDTNPQWLDHQSLQHMLLESSLLHG